MKRILLISCLALASLLYGAQSEDGRLIGAAKTHNVSEAMKALSNGANVNASDGRFTALMYASRNGSNKVADLLLQSGADVNLGIGGHSPLSLATSKQHEDIVWLLLKHGAVVDSKECPAVVNVIR